MWYFAWILGGALAASFAVLNALWFETDPRCDRESAE
ncbi:MAG: cyd operon protein YbgT [Gammaproteobacteria bacterium RIFCSPHIGHO2_12_FULL_41_15]|nr:MAG: cyd operon protein YbgT [Gammaproteobacteria bacterium RIFCSPHIGHO2_12_FULL_41_15]